MFHERTKHIDFCYHFFREVIACGDITVSKIITHDKLVNMMTKTLSVSKLKYFLDLVGALI